METFYFGEHPSAAALIKANLLQFGVLSAFGLLVGVCLFVVTVREDARSVRSGAARRRSTWQAAGLCSGVTLSIWLTVYYVNWCQFYQLDVRGEQVRLRYFVPERTVTLPRSAIRELLTASNPRGLPQMVIHTDTGKRYKGQLMRPDHYAVQLNRIQQLLLRSSAEPPSPFTECERTPSNSWSGCLG